MSQPSTAIEICDISRGNSPSQCVVSRVFSLQFYLVSPLIVLFLMSATRDEWRRTFQLPPLLTSWCGRCSPDTSANVGDAAAVSPPSDSLSVQLSTPLLVRPVCGHEAAGAFVATSVQECATSESIVAEPVASIVSARLRQHMAYKVAFLSVLVALAFTIQTVFFVANAGAVGDSAPQFYFYQVYQSMYCRMVPYIFGIGLAFALRVRVCIVSESEPDAAKDELCAIANGESGVSADNTSSQSVAVNTNISASSINARDGGADGIIDNAVGVNHWPHVAPRWVGHALACVAIAVPVYTGSGILLFFRGDSMWTHLALFQLFATRPLLAAGVAWLLYHAQTRRARLVRWFLSARVWIPIARLSYSAYLLQYIVLGCVLRGFLNARVPLHY